MNLSRYNPFPLPVWALFLIMFIAGYFTGAFAQSLAIEKHQLNTCNYIEHMLNR